MAASLFLVTAVQAAEVRLVASAALKPAYLELIPKFESATGHKVLATWSSSQVIQKRIAGGEDADLVIMADVLGRNLTEELIGRGILVASSYTVFAKSGIGIAVRAGAPKMDITSTDSLRSALLGAKSVAYSAGASGTFIASMLQKLGIYDAVKPKLAVVKPSEPVGDVVARGDAEIGFHQISELLPVRGILYLGPLPPELQNITVYSGALHSASKEASVALALAKFLTATSVGPTLKKHGLEPP